MRDTSTGPSVPLPLKSTTTTTSVKRKPSTPTSTLRGRTNGDYSPVSSASVDSKRSTTRRNETILPFPSRRTEKCDVFVFGAGSMGELGLGATSRDRNVKRPRLNVHLSTDKVGIVDVAIGGMHVAALDSEGRVWTWGVNDQGSLGRDTKTSTAIKEIEMKDGDDSDSDSEEEELNPMESKPGLVQGFPEGVKVVKLACGDSISVAIADDGMVYSWGTFRVSLSTPFLFHDQILIECRRQMDY
jgi:regulator of chromosome condensation